MPVATPSAFGQHAQNAKKSVIFFNFGKLIASGTSLSSSVYRAHFKNSVCLFARLHEEC